MLLGRQLRRQDAKALLERDALARKLVVWREARRVRRLGGAALRILLLHTAEWTVLRALTIKHEEVRSVIY